MAHELLVLTRIAVVVFGTVVAYLSLRAHKRTGSRAMFFLFLGFLFTILGALSAGILFEFFEYGLTDVYTFDSVMTTVGFLSIIYSIYGTSS